MKKRIRRKQQKRTSVGLRSHLRELWFLGVLTGIIVCLLLLILTSNHTQVSTIISVRSTPGTTNSTPLAISNVGQGTQSTTGIFPLATGGPIPVPANVLHPTNIARVILANELISIYAGSMARTPAIGVLAVLQENLITGQQSLHLYQTAQPVGALTILNVQQHILTIASAKTKGTFDLNTDQFLFEAKQN